MLGLFLVQTPFAMAQQGDDESATLYEPVKKQIVQIGDENLLPDWNISTLETFGIKLLIRGKEALTWTLNIEDGGFHNPAIEETYITVLTIVNSLFVLGLLAIASMWMFSILVPRKTLKKVILLYALAVIFVNFALPVNQLFIDGANLLQKTLLIGKDGNIKITDIVQTPSYESALSYRNEEAGNLISTPKKIGLDLAGSGVDIPVGKISITGQPPETIAMTSDPIEVYTDSQFSVFQEQTAFRFLILTATALAYFLIAMLFILRIVILWALLILSPVLLVLGIFQSTRGWFYNWLSVYGRWLLIGPIVALGIAIIVNIWQLSGLPITVDPAYTPETFSTVKDSNVLFYLPGTDTPNTLSNTQEMMEYMIFLIMLYLPIFMAFALTRKRLLQSGASTLSRQFLKPYSPKQSKMSTFHESEKEIKNTEKGFMTNLRELVSEKFGFGSETSRKLEKLHTTPEHPTVMMETASNFLPENLSSTPLPKMLELLGQEKSSMKSHHRVMEKLAHVANISEAKQREQVGNVLNEIQSRAEKEDKESMAILHEIENIKSLDQSAAISAQSSEAQMKDATAGINIQLTESKAQVGKKVQDRSENQDNGKKNVGKKRKHRHHKKHHKEKNLDNPPSDAN